MTAIFTVFIAIFILLSIMSHYLVSSSGVNQFLGPFWQLSWKGFQELDLNNLPFVKESSPEISNEREKGSRTKETKDQIPDNGQAIGSKQSQTSNVIPPSTLQSSLDSVSQPHSVSTASVSTSDSSPFSLVFGLPTRTLQVTSR